MIECGDIEVKKAEPAQPTQPDPEQAKTPEYFSLVDCTGEAVELYAKQFLGSQHAKATHHGHVSTQHPASGQTAWVSTLAERQTARADDGDNVDPLADADLKAMEENGRREVQRARREWPPGLVLTSYAYRAILVPKTEDERRPCRLLLRCVLVWNREPVGE